MALLLPSLADAGSATWDLNPTGGDWNTAANLTPQTVPDVLTDTATLGTSNVTEISISESFFVAGMVFESDASAYNFLCAPLQKVTIYKNGIQNDLVSRKA